MRRINWALGLDQTSHFTCVEYNVNIFDCDAAENVLRVKRRILHVSNKIY